MATVSRSDSLPLWFEPGAATLSGQSSNLSEQLSELVGAQFSNTLEGFEAVLPSTLLSRRTSSLGEAGAAKVVVVSSDGAAGAVHVDGAGKPAGADPAPGINGHEEEAAAEPAAANCGAQMADTAGSGAAERAGLVIRTVLFDMDERSSTAVRLAEGEDLQEECMHTINKQDSSTLKQQQGQEQLHAEQQEQQQQQGQQIGELQANKQQAAQQPVGVGSSGTGTAHVMPPSWHDEWPEGGETHSMGDGYWGTPIKGGTPRAADAAKQQQHFGTGGGSLAAALMRRMAKFDEISKMISEDGEGSGQQQQQHHPQKQLQHPTQALPLLAPQSPTKQRRQQQHQAHQAADAAAPIASFSSDAPPASDLPIAAAVAAAEEDAAIGDAGMLLAESSSDMTIGTMMVDEGVPDVGPRPLSGRSSWRASRTTIDQVG